MKDLFCCTVWSYFPSEICWTEQKEKKIIFLFCITSTVNRTMAWWGGRWRSRRPSGACHTWPSQDSERNSQVLIDQSWGAFGVMCLVGRHVRIRVSPPHDASEASRRFLKQASWRWCNHSSTETPLRYAVWKLNAVSSTVEKYSPAWEPCLERGQYVRKENTKL